MKTICKDNIYATPRSSIEDFKFDEQVADVFNDMIYRSVPNYNVIVYMIGLLVRHYAVENCNIYDLGCSTGTVTNAIIENVNKKVNVKAVDNSEAMLNKFRRGIKNKNSMAQVTCICDDIENIHIKNASVVILSFTLQFIDPKNRLKIIENIYNGMIEGGVLVISDKIAFEDPFEYVMKTELYEIFKKSNGYSELEISQKRTALENVLIPDTIQVHHQRLKKAGFMHSSQWFQNFNFASIVAFK